MAENPLIKRYLDAGMAFTQMTQARAEAIVKDLVKAGEVQAQRAEELVASLVERSKQNTDRLLEVVRSEVRSQIAGLGLATQDDIARLEREIARTGSTSKVAASRKSGARKSGVKKSGARKSTVKKSGARTAAAKKTAGGRNSS